MVATQINKVQAMAVTSHIDVREGSGLGRLQAAVEGYRAAVARYRVYLNTFNEMNALSDRDLADLGLHRSELRRVAHQAAYDAP